MFKIKVNANIQDFLQQINRDQLITNEELKNLIEVEKSISIHALIELYSKYKNNKSNSQHDIKTLLKPLEFKFKEKSKPGSSYSPEFKKQLDSLRYKLNEKEYQDMIKEEPLIKNIHDTRIDNPDTINMTPSQMNRQIREQITTVFNILLSVVSVVFAIWYWSRSSSRFPVEIRILLCLFFGILVLVADVVVYNGYLKKLDESKVKERSKKEKKKVIKTIQISGDNSKKPHQN
ncbi:vacuolar ATPase assembly integral membrane protein Vph2p [Monosporozyma servazzii]